jgi:hypothetical protein
MCVSGSWTDSYQVRRVFGARAYMDFAFLIWLSGQTRRKLPVPRWIPPVAVAVVVISIAAIGTYNYQIKKFWDEIRGDCPMSACSPKTRVTARAGNGLPETCKLERGAAQQFTSTLPVLNNTPSRAPGS